METELDEKDPELHRSLRQSGSKIGQAFSTNDQLPRPAGNQSIAPPIVVSDSVEGWVDHVHQNRIVGWARFPDRPAVRVPLLVMRGPDVIAKGIALRFRSDVEAAGKGDGYCGFSIPLPKGEAWRREDLQIVVGGLPGAIQVPPVTQVSGQTGTMAREVAPCAAQPSALECVTSLRKKRLGGRQ